MKIIHYIRNLDIQIMLIKLKLFLCHYLACSMDTVIKQSHLGPLLQTLCNFNPSMNIWIDTNIKVIFVSLTTWKAHHSPRAVVSFPGR